jgi:hypothetical protein
MPLPICMRLRAEERIAHALGVGGKVVHGPLWDTARLPWLRWNGRQRLDCGDERFMLSLFEQRAGVRGPDRSHCCAASKDSMGYVPHMFFGMREIHDLHGPCKVFGGQIPDPWRAVAQHDHQASLALAHTPPPDGRATSQSRPWPCDEPHNAHCLLLAYPPTRKAANSDRLGPLSARNTAPALISRYPSPFRCTSSCSIGTLPRRIRANTPSSSLYSRSIALCCCRSFGRLRACLASASKAITCWASEAANASPTCRH